MKTNRKICRLGISISNSVLVALFVVFTVINYVIDSAVSSYAGTTAVSNMQTAAADRSEMIESYIHSAEDTLTAYLKADQIYDLLRDPDNEEYAAAAQEYTEEFSEDITNLEGIYASSWDTKMLTHTNPGSVGIVTRPDEERREQLHSAILATQGVYNTGILISPATGEQIISMYKAVREADGTHIGLGGIGIYTSGLIEKLNSLPIDGLPGAEYYLVNIGTGEYIFHPDTEKIATVAKEEFIADIIAQVGGKDKDICGSLEYKDEVGEDCIAAYNSMSGQGWVFIMSDTAEEVLADAYSLRIAVVLIFLAAMVLISAAVYLIVSKMIHPLKSVENSAAALSGLRLGYDSNIEKYTVLNDEIGSIAKAVNALSIALKNVRDDIGRILGEMADENFTVDVDENEAYYIGDFDTLADGAQKLSEGTIEQTSSISELENILPSIANNIIVCNAVKGGCKA